MARKVQKSDGKGSLKQLQILVNKNIELINYHIKDHFNSLLKSEIEWLSPLADDDYAEYTDDDFIEKIGLDPQEINLKNFWPAGGPNWDALAKTNKKEIILVEAKANIPELISTPSKAGEKSMKKIKESFNKTKNDLNKNNNIDWTGKFYQYTNRIAHLNFLREKCKQKAFLINIYFTGDKSVDGPNTTEEWKGAIQVMNLYLGLNSHLLKKYMADIFIDVSELKN